MPVEILQYNSEEEMLQKMPFLQRALEHDDAGNHKSMFGGPSPLKDIIGGVPTSDVPEIQDDEERHNKLTEQLVAAADQELSEGDKLAAMYREDMQDLHRYVEIKDNRETLKEFLLGLPPYRTLQIREHLLMQAVFSKKEGYNQDALDEALWITKEIIY